MIILLIRPFRYCFYVTTQLTDDALPVVCKTYSGTLQVNDEFAYSFVESSATQPAPKRNPITYHGTYINLHRNSGGYQYPTFTRPEFSESYSVSGFLRKAVKEMLKVANKLDKANNGLVEK